VQQFAQESPELVQKLLSESWGGTNTKIKQKLIKAGVSY
jgi:hypothetical protein